MYRNLTLTFLLIALSFAGCSKPPAPPKTVAKPVPSWYMNPKNNDAKYIYGVGMGESKEEATRAALNEMIGRLSISIESTYKRNEQVRSSAYGESFNADTQSEIKATISKIKISNYEYVQSEKLKYKEYVVMLRVEKAKFFQSLQNNIDTKISLIKNEISGINEESNILVQYNGYKKANEKADDLLKDISILSALNPAFEKEKYLTFVEQQKKSFQLLHEHLNFVVIGDNKSHEFVTKIKNLLAQKSFHLASKKNSYSVVIKLETKERISKSSIGSIAVLTLDVKAFSHSERIGGKTVILKERFNGSMDSVYKNAAIHFEEDLKEKNINEVLGINLEL